MKITRRIEAHRIALRRIVANIPDDASELLEVGDRVRHGGPEPEAACAEDRLQTLLEEKERIDSVIGEAKRELLEGNLGLVVSIAKRYRGGSLALPDLIQEGNIGLMKAVDQVRFRRGVKFTRHATWWIRREITVSKYSRAGRAPLPAEPVELPVGAGPDLESLLDAERERVPDRDLVRRDLERLIDQALGTLDPKEQRVLRLRFGIGDLDDHTFEEIGRRIGVSGERARQIERKALAKLRRPLAEAAVREFARAGSRGSWRVRRAPR